MTSSSAIHVSAGCCQIAILRDARRLTLCATKRILFVLGIVLLTMGAKSALAQTQTSPTQTCAIINGGDAGGTGGVRPSYLANQDGRANEGCTVLITLNADGSITTTTPNPAFSYENGDDDNMIGVVNNTGQTIASIQLSSATAPIFGFDGDGLCGGPPGWTFSALGPKPNCANPADPHRYGQGPITFTVTTPFKGIVNFGTGNLARGTSTFFSLEGGNIAAGLQVKIPDPVLVFRKSGPATMILAQRGTFGLDVQNTGGSDAWNTTIVDKLPTGATGGMCTAAPQILSVQVFAADGVTPVPGKGPLTAGADYTVSFAPAPVCTLTLNLMSAAAVISPTQRLIVTYQTQLDANTQKGITLTNVAGATQWYNGPSSNTGRLNYTCALTNGTPGVLDCQDAHTVSVPIFAVTLTKGGPATMYLGLLGRFTLNVQNTGTTDAWNATLTDKLPTGATGGMCAATPQILSAQVFAADGVTPVPGKGPLAAGTDYTVSYAGAPACTLTFNTLSAASVISPTQRLIVTYQTQLDANTQTGITLTNVAGATQWYSGPSSDTGRQTSTCTLTNGTPGVLDCQDAHTVTVASGAVTITKQVTVVGGGPPAPGATLDYLVHVTNNSPYPVSPLVITDDLNAAGPGALTYVTGTATVNGAVTGVTVTGNVITVNYSATYGPLAPAGTIDLRFRATLGRTLATGTSVTNTGVVTYGNPPQTASASVSVQLNIPPGALTVNKTTPLVDVTRGQLVPYTIIVTNVLSGPVQGAALVDSFPAGFRYVKGSARLDDRPAEPTLAEFQLIWSNLSFAGGQQHTILLLLAVGAGVGEGQFVNRAQAFSQVIGPPVNQTQPSIAAARKSVNRAQAPAVTLGSPVSSQASATVVVVPDITFDCTDIIGKVFVDVNGNGHQDPGESGIPGVRIVTTRGLAAITDEFGRFHITCAITPLEGRGSNFALKLDDRTLPSGYRLTTPQVVVERATRGKALRFEFGASIHRVVSLDLSDAVFEPGTADMRLQWRPRLDVLLAELRKSRSILRLSYLADVEDKPLADRRLESVDHTISDAWRAMNCCYELTIEREVFWLRGSPPKDPVERLRGVK